MVFHQLIEVMIAHCVFISLHFSLINNSIHRRYCRVPTEIAAVEQEWTIWRGRLRQFRELPVTEVSFFSSSFLSICLSAVHSSIVCVYVCADGCIRWFCRRSLCLVCNR